MANTIQQAINGLFYTIANVNSSSNPTQVTGLTVANLDVTKLSITGGSTGQVLTYAANGTAHWANPTGSSGGSGTVTSVTTTGSALGFSLSGGPITTTGTVTLTGPTVTDLRTTLGIANIANIALNGNSGQVITGSGSFIPVPTGSGSGTVTQVTGNGSGLGFSLGGTVTTTGNITLTAPTASELITNMGLGNIATVNATGSTTNYLRADGTWQPVTSSGTSLPSQTGNSGKFLKTDGTNLSWDASGGSGTVTQVTGSGSGLGFSLGGTVTTSGSITLATPTTTQLKTSLGLGNIVGINFNNDNQTYLRGDGNWTRVTTDPIPNVPNLNGSTTSFLRGDGTWSIVPMGTVAQLNLNSNSQTYLNGMGQWTAPSGVTGVTAGNNISITGTATAPVVNCDTFKFAKELANIQSIPTTAIVVGVKNGSIYYNSATATSVATVNIIGDSTTTLNSMMNVGETLTVTVMITNGATPQGISSVSIDGTVRTVKMLNGSDLTGVANSITSYTFTIIKTAATPTYTVIGSKVRYA